MNTPNIDRSTQQQQQPGTKPHSPGQGAPGTDQPRDRPPGYEKDKDKDRGAQRPGQSRPNDPDRDHDRGGHGVGQTGE